MLRAFDHAVATCCDVLCVVGSSLKLIKFEPTTSQNVTIRRNRVIKRAQHVVYCSQQLLRLYVAISLSGFKSFFLILVIKFCAQILNS